jgi:hypothetical protein
MLTHSGESVDLHKKSNHHLDRRLFPPHCWTLDTTFQWVALDIEMKTTTAVSRHGYRPLGRSDTAVVGVGE